MISVHHGTRSHRLRRKRYAAKNANELIQYTGTAQINLPVKAPQIE